MRLEDPQRAIPDMVVRVAQVEDGDPVGGRIKVTVVQDVFSFPAASFSGDQPPTWTKPNFIPCVGRHKVFEMPYFLVNRVARPADFALLDNASAFVGAVVEQGRPTNMGFDMAVRIGSPDGSEVPDPADQLYCGYTPPV